MEGDGELIFCIQNNFKQLYAILIDQFTGNIDYRGTKGKTPLMWACERGRESIAHDLINRGADPNLTDDFGASALLYASKNANADKSYIDIISLLIRKSVDVNLKDSEGNTPLSNAFLGKSLRAMRLLIKAGADVNVCKIHDLLRREDVFYEDYIMYINLLLDSGLKITDNNIFPQYFIRDNQERHDLIRKIVLAGYDVQNILLGENFVCDLESVKFLVDLGANPLATKSTKNLNFSAFGNICKRSCVKDLNVIDILKFMLERGVDINQRSCFVFSVYDPLAVFDGNILSMIYHNSRRFNVNTIEMFKFFIENGVNVNDIPKSATGDKPPIWISLFEFFIRYGRYDLMILLIESGAKDVIENIRNYKEDRWGFLNDFLIRVSHILEIDLDNSVMNYFNLRNYSKTIDKRIMDEFIDKLTEPLLEQLKESYRKRELIRTNCINNWNNITKYVG